MLIACMLQLQNEWRRLPACAAARKRCRTQCHHVAWLTPLAEHHARGTLMQDSKPLQHFVSTMTLIRYLKARSWHLQRATKMLQATLAW